jgi:hypothetical protein
LIELVDEDGRPDECSTAGLSSSTSEWMAAGVVAVTSMSCCRTTKRASWVAAPKPEPSTQR